jgi:hypothetical protein
VNNSEQQGRGDEGERRRGDRGREKKRREGERGKDEGREDERRGRKEQGGKKEGEEQGERKEASGRGFFTNDNATASSNDYYFNEFEWMQGRG